MADRPIETFEGEGGLLWRAVADEAEWVRSAVAARPGGVLSLPGATTVKENPVRSVVRVPREGRSAVYVKRFRVRGVGDRLKFLVVPSRAEAEWRASRGMRDEGIPAADVVAVAEARFGGVLRNAMLVVREVPDAMELVPFLFDRYPGGGPWVGEEAQSRRSLLRRLGTLVRSLHDAGFVHPDLHGGNILVTRNETTPSITIIDLHTVRRRAVVAPGTREENLAKLLHSMLTATSRADRARVVRAYEGKQPMLFPGAVLRRIEGRIQALEDRRVRNRTRPARLLGESGRHAVRRVDGTRVVFLRRLGPDPFLAALEAHREVSRSGSEDILKRGGRSLVTRVSVPGPGGALSLVVKETRVRGWKDLLRNALLRPRAVRSWIHGYGLWHRHLDTAEPMAVAVRGRWPLLRESFLVMEDVSAGGERFDCRALERWGEGPLPRKAFREKRDEVLAFGRFVGDLHARGVYHGDLKAVNVFVRRKHGKRSFCLVDFDRVRFGVGTVGRRRRVKNLAQLAASLGAYFTRTDRLRFYAAYATQVRGAWPDRRDVAAAVAAACARKIVVTRDPIE